MAKILRINLELQATSWHVLVGNQGVRRGKNKLPHAQYALNPQYFYIFGKTFKINTRGADQKCPWPLNPPIDREGEGM